MFERLVRLQAAIEAAESAVYWARIGSSYSRPVAGGPTSEQLELLSSLLALRADLVSAAGVPVDLAEEAILECTYRAQCAHEIYLEASMASGQGGCQD
jgi:hypothetical protein